MGTFGTLSFHETKNVISGEGGAILVNDENYVYDVEVAREKGTDRTRFRRGEVNKYTWQSLGSSYLPGELIAAFLWAQLQEASRITRYRIASWNYYNDQLSTMELSSKLRRPIIPAECTHSGHMYYILLDEGIDRSFVLEKLVNAGIGALFHYVPLHSSPAGRKYGRVSTAMDVTESSSSRIIRLPMWMGISRELQDRVLETLSTVLKDC
jgi:dTDP-4-amino-4,6-dideoxygalactose transaminase